MSKFKVMFTFDVEIEAETESVATVQAYEELIFQLSNKFAGIKNQKVSKVWTMPLVHIEEVENV